MLYEVPQDELIKKVAEELKSLISVPEWANYAKTGVQKQRPPVDGDWWYIRAASVLRKVYLLGPIGVSKLRTKYGGIKNRGVKPEKFKKGSGSVARKVLQELEKAGLVKQDVKDKHKGRVVTPKGVSLLFSAAKAIAGGMKTKAIPKAKEEKKEVTKKAPEENKENKKTEKPKEKKEKPAKEKAVEKETKPEPVKEETKTKVVEVVVDEPEKKVSEEEN